jgi:hypothetical protein
MPLRTYTDREGLEWRVWTVTPVSAGTAMLEASYREGWLCFERLDGTDRRRLTMAEVPAAWDTLPDERLDLLRRVAEPAGKRSGAPGTDTADRPSAERPVTGERRPGAATSDEGSRGE